MDIEQLKAEIRDAEQAANFASAYGFDNSYRTHSARAAEFRRQLAALTYDGPTTHGGADHAS